ncbi:hypothetical protein FHS95_003634 [Sphingomonas naasensis]|uniref:Uncharacterized protein n=1 Tax=Sphingomonas naasensis TaxID=1344951 RepID=A0A4S1WMN5_9SPHN|nr:hypothetical protein [Sphingomonas naasensis]NIJ21923.1 hypothetical protein [Sphingomonas naasensis]TGX42386.1 hypothetical protein E5A74_11110 [Sphingomonas naasensis]
MSTPQFLAVMIATGSLFVASAYLLGKLLEPVFGAEASGRRLQRRLDRRLARGEDRYFEELRSIESAIAAQATTAPRRLFAWPLVATLPLGIVTMGLMLAPLLLPDEGPMAPPAWTRHWVMVWLIYLGAVNLADPQSSAFSPSGARAMGAFMIALGLVAVACSFF